MRTTLMAALAALLLTTAPFATPAFADDAKSGDAKTADPIVGEWYILTEFGGQERTSRIAIARAADGGLSGTYYDSSGSSSALTEVAFEKGILSFKRTMGPRSIGFKATIDGETIQGSHLLGQREIPARGVRGKDAFDKLMAAHRKANERGDDLEADYEKHKRRAAPRDAFPVLFDPKMAKVADAKSIRDDEPVIGVFLGGEAMAYPISIMGIHELVNATCGGQPIAASW